MQGNTLSAETMLVRGAVRQVKGFLPSTWSVRYQAWHRSGENRWSADGALTVMSPGNQAVFPVVVKTGSWGRSSAQLVVEHLLASREDHAVLLITSFAGPALREACEADGVSYADQAGWLHLRHDETGLFVSREGAAKPPAPPRRGTMNRLDGPGASALIKALWDARTPIGVRALANAAQVSAGTSAKVLPTLAQYGAIERGPRGEVLTVDRRLLLERWVEDYGVFTSNPEVHWYLAARGTKQARDDLDDLPHIKLLNLQIEDPELVVAHTGYPVAHMGLPDGIHPVIPDTLLSLYSPDPEGLATAMRLRPAPRQRANVVIIRPRDESLLTPYNSYVPLPQALADLLTMGGRFPELAEQVLEYHSQTHPSPGSESLGSDS